MKKTRYQKALLLFNACIIMSIVSTIIIWIEGGLFCFIVSLLGAFHFFVANILHERFLNNKGPDEKKESEISDKYSKMMFNLFNSSEEERDGSIFFSEDDSEIEIGIVRASAEKLRREGAKMEGMTEEQIDSGMTPYQFRQSKI